MFFFLYIIIDKKDTKLDQLKIIKNKNKKLKEICQIAFTNAQVFYIILKRLK